MYDLPGGRIEEGESKEYALNREFQEEVGCDVESHEFMYDDNYECLYESQSRGNVNFHHTGSFYEVEIPVGVIVKSVPDGHDSMGAIYINLSDISDKKVLVAPMALKAILSAI
jgi:8-oxo-dGTP pyrophosphatase MutT (NUDIX family)